MGNMDTAVSIGTKRVPTCGIETAVIHIYERDGYFTSIWNKLFRREVIMKGDSFIAMDTTLSFGEDELWLAQVLCNSRKMAFVPEALYHWRPREGSVSRANYVTDKQMSVLTAKMKALNALPQSELVQNIVKTRMYNDCFSLKAQAYCMGNWDKYRIIGKTIKPMRWYWLRSSDPTHARKVKILLMEIAMVLRLPKSFVQRVNRITRFGINTNT